MSLEAIVYVSTAVTLLSEAELQRLLLGARRRNHEHQVTGVLLHNGGTFFQYIEGEPERLASIYRLIHRAPEHHGIIELLHEPIGERVFPDWHMGFTEATQTDLLTLSQANWQRTWPALEKQAAPSMGLSLLISHWQSARH